MSYLNFFKWINIYVNPQLMAFFYHQKKNNDLSIYFGNLAHRRI